MKHLGGSLVWGAVCLLVVGATSPATAQKPAAGAAKAPAATAAPAPKDAREVLEAAQSTLSALKSWSFHSRMTSQVAGAVVFGSDAQITMRHGDDGSVTGVRMTGNMLPSGPRFDAASDGARIRVLDRDAKLYEEGPFSPAEIARHPPGASADIFMMLWVVPIEFLQPQSFVGPGQANARLNGTATINGVLCDVVEIEQVLDAPGEQPAKQVHSYVFGRDDHLPRRMVLSSGPVKPTADQPVMSTPRELNQWKVNPAVDDATFVLDVTGAKEGKFKINLAGGGAPGGSPGDPGSNGPSLGLKRGDQPPDFALPDTTGKVQKLSSYAKKVLIIHFTEAGGVSTDAFLAKLKSKVGDKASVLELVLQRGAPAPDPKKVKPTAWPRCFSADSVADAWAVNVFPVMLLIGADGKVVMDMPTGVVGGASVDSLVEAFVKKLNAYLKAPAKGW